MNRLITWITGRVLGWPGRAPWWPTALAWLLVVLGLAVAVVAGEVNSRTTMPIEPLAALVVLLLPAVAAAEYGLAFLRLYPARRRVRLGVLGACLAAGALVALAYDLYTGLFVWLSLTGLAGWVLMGEATLSRSRTDAPTVASRWRWALAVALPVAAPGGLYLYLWLAWGNEWWLPFWDAGAIPSWIHGMLTAAVAAVLCAVALAGMLFWRRHVLRRRMRAAVAKAE